MPSKPPKSLLKNIKNAKSSPSHPPLKHSLSTFLPFNTHLSNYQRFIKTFIDSEGKCYLKSIIISYQRPNQKNWPVLTIYINETNCESENFEDNMKAYEGNGEQRADRIKNLFTIKKVEFDFWPVDYSKTNNH